MHRTTTSRTFAPADAGNGAATSEGGAPAPGAAAIAAAEGAASGLTQQSLEGAGVAVTGKWWEDRRLDDRTRTMLTAKGLTVVDPVEAMAKFGPMYLNAETRLGKDPAKLMERPEDPAKLGEWMRQNREAFGLPEDVKGYAVGELKLPEGMPRDEALEAKLGQIAFDNGVSPAAFKAMAAAYAEQMGSVYESAGSDLAAAGQALEAELRKEWGQAYGAKTEQARRGAEAVLSRAGLDENARFAFLQGMKDKGGDALAMKVFATVGEMMGEDGLRTGTGAGMMMTPADARAQIARMTSTDGEMGKAVKADDRARIAELQPQIERLAKIAAGG